MVEFALTAAPLALASTTRLAARKVTLGTGNRSFAESHYSPMLYYVCRA